jgi:hypothetical protein
MFVELADGSYALAESPFVLAAKTGTGYAD